MALIASQGFGAAFSIAMVLVIRDPVPDATALVWASLGGICGLIGLSGLYLSLARGAMGLVAPLTAVIAAVIPALFGILRGDPLEPFVAVGLLLAIAAVGIVAMPQPGPEGAAQGAAPGASVRTGVSGWVLILISGLGFAAFFLCVDQAHAAGADPWWTLASARSTSLSLLVLGAVVLTLLGRTSMLRGARGVLPLALAAAVGDTGGNVLFVLSRSETTLAVSVVLSSLYPVSTAILAWVVLHERLSRLALVGVSLAIAGVVLIGYGSTLG